LKLLQFSENWRTGIHQPLRGDDYKL